MYQEFHIIYIRPSSAFTGAADTKIVTFIELIMQMRMLRGVYLMLEQLAHANGVDLKVFGTCSWSRQERALWGKITCFMSLTFAPILLLCFSCHYIPVNITVAARWRRCDAGCC